MKKLMLIFMLITTATVLSANTKAAETVLDIKGYKVAKNSDQVELVITDAITGSLNTIDSTYAEIDLSEDVGSLLGDASKGASSFSDQTVFSYRITGYTPVKYQLDMTFTPFKRSDEENQQEAYITACYELGNLSYSFPDYSSDNHNGDKIGVLNKSTNVGSVVVNGEAGSSGTLSTAFEIYDGNDGIVPRWIHRGAVALTIDNTSYAAAPIGEAYIANVTVSLTTII